MSRLSERVAAIAESATLAVDAKAKALQAAGKPVIGFGAGEPDFPTPANVVTAAAAAAADPKAHKYTPAPGLPALREAIAKATSANGIEVKAENVIVTNGGKQAIFNTMATLINPGDEVILQAPYWVTYPEVVTMFGGVPVVVNSDETTGYRVTVEQLEAARTPRTKMLIFVSPSNPTGAVYSPADVAAIGAWAAEHDLWVMTDEIYQHLIYGEAEFASLPALVPAAADKTVIVSGVAKTYSMTGWRVGWMVGPVDVIKGASNLQSHMTSNVANVSQYAALEALTGPQDAIAEMLTAFDRRRHLIVDMLNAAEGVTCPTPEGAFYAYPSVKGLLGKTLRGRTVDSSMTLAEIALDEALVAVVPGEAFGTPGYLRLSYATSDDNIAEGITRLQKLFAEAE